MNSQLNAIHLYQAIDVLSPKEWQGFLYFARNPLFNKNKKILALIVFLEQQYPQFNFTETDSWQSIFPNEDFDQQKLKDVRSQLFRLLKKFLALQELEKDETIWDLAVLQQIYFFTEPTRHSEFLIDAKKTGQIEGMAAL